MKAVIDGTCVSIDGQGVLLRGAPGAGKSDLALRLIDAGASLVSDDYCEVTVMDGALALNPPASIAGKIEIRGYGIVTLPFVESVKLQ
ncbi:MAG: HPr kinase/phosphatase C-terminal domain-containing protein, partial [Rhodospirillaceae bacterium]